MTETQMRALDTWIAEHVMGYKWYRFSMKDDTGKIWFTLAEPSHWQERHGGTVVASPEEGQELDLGNVAAFTRVPADAMDVLKKCHSETAFPILTGVMASGHYCELGDTCLVGMPPNINKWNPQETLELAICVFARKLFE